MTYQTKPSGVIDSSKGDKTLLKRINSEIEHYTNFRPISFPRFTRNQAELIRLIDSYYFSQYRDGDTDSLGQKKTFYNIVSLPVDVADKELDIDTKNIRIVNEDWAPSNGTILMESELRMWMKLGYFGRELDKYSFLLSKYGHLIVKKVKDQVNIVPIQNIIFRPDAKSFKDTPIIETHYYANEEDFKNEAESLGWEDYQLVLNEFRNDKKRELVIHEYFDPTAEGENYFIVSKYGNKLASMQLKDSIYKDCSFEDLPYRLMGRGQVEKLFEEQIYLNRIANYKAEGLHWSSKNIFQSRDANISSNLLGDTDNGDVLRVNDEIKRIDTREQNLQVYSYEEQRYESNAYRRAFSSNPMTGEGSASNVPFRALYMNAQQGGTYYKKKRDKFGSFVKEIIVDWVIPEFKNEKRKAHKVLMETIYSDDVKFQNFFNGIVDIKMAEENRRLKGMTPRQQEVKRAILREKMMKEPIEIPDSYYDNLKYNVEVDITGEAVDSGAKLQAYQTMATIVGQNPTVLQNPATARIFAKMFEVMGVNPIDIGLDRKSLEDVIGQQQAQVGGSIAAPSRQPMPNMAAQATTL